MLHVGSLRIGRGVWNVDKEMFYRKRNEAQDQTIEGAKLA